MLAIIGQVLPEAVGIALSPIPIIGLILMLLSKNARKNSLMFMLGWLAGLAVVAVIVLALVNAGRITAGESAAQTGVLWGKLLLGIALLLLAFRQWRSRPKPGQAASMPKWMATIDSVQPGRALVLGALLSGVNPKNLLLNAAAASVIAAAATTTIETAVATIVFILIASITIIGPVLYVQIAGARAEKGLTELKAWLTLHNAAIMTVLLLVIGVKLIGNGLGAF
ncbi:MAG: GAP family protein [Anaerolineae bacterium]|nr:GAP family protein [Anaerolineae bacterium]